MIFVVGFFLGSIFGAFVMAVLTAFAHSDMYAEKLNRGEYCCEREETTT